MKREAGKLPTRDVVKFVDRKFPLDFAGETG